MRVGEQFSGWTDVQPEDPPVDDLYRAAMWLVSRHPRLAHLAARIAGVIEVADDGPSLDVDHLAEVVTAEPRYEAAWRDYEQRHPAPAEDRAWERWRAAGPRPDEFAAGLADFAVMSSGERAIVRLLATFGAQRAPFRVSDLRSLDATGARVLADWCRAVQAGYGEDPMRAARSSAHRNASVPMDAVPYWPVEAPER